MSDYLPLIKFKFIHSFYFDGICRDVELHFSKQCKKTIANYGLILKKEPGSQYTLYIKSSDQIPELTDAFEREWQMDNDLLVFTVKTLNQKFYCYTDQLPNISKNQRSVYEFNIQDSNSTEMKISFVDVKQASPELKSHFDSPNTLAIIQIKISSLSGGIFKKTLDEKKPIELEIDYEAKTAFWKYILLPRSTHESALKIKDSNDEIEFSEIEWTSFNNQEKAGVSQSLEKIRLSDQYSFHLQLWKNYNNGKRIILEQLSMPNIENPESFSVDSEMNNYITIYQYF